MSALLSFVRFKDFSIWDVKSQLLSIMLSNYKIVKLGNYINEETSKIKPFEYPNDSFKILGVSNKIGLFDNEIKKGKDINQAYKIVKDNFLAYNPYRINIGSIGLKTNKQKNDLISPAYVVFSSNKELCSEYLFLIFKTQTFNMIINESTRGSVRQILAFDILENLKIPLPTLKNQKKLVQDYQDKSNLALKQEQEAKNKEKEIEEYLYEELGIKLSTKDEDTLFNFVHFKNIERWDATYLLDSNNIQSKYNLTPISSIINTFLKDLDNSSLRINSKNYPTNEFKYIGMENIEKETGKLLNFQKVKGIDIKSQTIQLPKNFFLYGKLRPYLNKYYLNKNDDKNIIVSSEFFVFSVQNVNATYFKFILSSSFIQSQIKNHMKGARMPRISEDTFKNLKLPLPLLDIQDKIADHITKLKEEIQELKKQSVKNRNLALIEFEQEIFNND